MVKEELLPNWNFGEPAEVEKPNQINSSLGQATITNNVAQHSTENPNLLGMRNSAQPNIGEDFSSSAQPSSDPDVFGERSPAFQFDSGTTSQKSNQNYSQVAPFVYDNDYNNVTPASNSSIPVKRYTDLDDNTVREYLKDYDYGVSINDYQAQINALTAIDNYRATKGLKPIYAGNIYELTNQRTKKIESKIRDYEDEISIAMNMGDDETAQQLIQQLNDYKKMVDYQPTMDNAATFLQGVQYKSNWDNAINGIVQQLLTAQFTYNPSDDQALLKAQQYATNVVYESMNAKGILDSTMTAQMVTKTVNELIPVYQKMAKEEFYENIERLQTMANFIIKLDDRDYSRWQDEVARQLEVYQAKRDEISYQWDRVNTMGYVDNEASIILGVAVGTMSPSRRQAIDEAQAEIEKEYRKLQSDILLAEAKKQLDYQYSIQEYSDKAAIDVSKSQTKANINVSEYAQKQAIKAAYDQATPQNIVETEQISNSYNTSNTNAPKVKTEDEIATEVFKSLQDTYGKLDSNTAPYYAAEITTGYNNGIINEDIMLKLYNKIEKYINPESKSSNIASNAMSPIAKKLTNSK